jgi:ribonuclease BN (tRNA processing enzyme)
MGKLIIIDAGSGLVRLEAEMRDLFPNYFRENTEPVDMLISHLHMDHIIGLSVFGPVWGKKAGVRIYTNDRETGTLKEQVFGAFVPPYWPASMVENANAECIAMFDKVPLQLGPFSITPFNAVHPDDTLGFIIADENKTVAHLLDSEMAATTEAEYSRLAERCRDVDLVIFDAAYSLEDYKKSKKGWGHSTVEDGIRLAEVSNCKKMVFSHFSYDYNDDMLAEMEKKLAFDTERFFFARDGMEIDL